MPEPGTLFLVVGPSGAGKDTVIAGAREALSGDANFMFARRVVTRPEGQWEQHDSVSDTEFLAAQARGEFALAWQAHGLNYGVPATIEGEIAVGRHIIVNTSRRIIAEAKARFPHVRVVLVTAPPDVLNARIAARGRDAGVPSRAERATKLNDGLEADVTIINDRSPEEAVGAMIACLRGVKDGVIANGARATSRDSSSRQAD